MHPKDLQIEDFTYPLPDERIARYPVTPRDASKLLVYRQGTMITDTYAALASHLPPDSLLVLNQTRVIKARLLLQRATGGTIELFALEPHKCYPDVPTAMLQKGTVLWQCLVGGIKKWKPDEVLSVLAADGSFKLEAAMEARNGNVCVISFTWDAQELTFAEVLHHMGAIPLPPYLKRKAEDRDTDTYQTIYARDEGSVAAPTAGLHFTDELMSQLTSKGVATSFVTLHVGAGTFMPVKTTTMEAHPMHSEWIEVSLSWLQQLRDHLGKPVVAVGTTSLRTIESVYHIGNRLFHELPVKWQGNAISQWDPYETNLFCTAEEAIDALIHWLKEQHQERLVTRTQILIAPGYRFRMAQGLITNFHQPQSTLLLLVAALVGEDWRNIYDYALANDFRFLSYGDGSLLWAHAE